MSALVIGESLIDVISRKDAKHPGAETRHVGGSPLNVAVGLARLGQEVRFLTRFGDDSNGQLIADYLSEEDVDVIRVRDDHPTSLAYASLDAAGNHSYRFELVSEYPAPPLNSADRAALLQVAPDVIHIGSLGTHLAPGADTVAQWVELFHPESTITYDPNVRMNVGGSAAKYVAHIEDLMPFVDVVKASLDDVEQLFGSPEPQAASRYFLDRGARLVVITAGDQGSYLATKQNILRVPPATVDVVDTLGAGDSYMSALIDGLSRISVLGASERAQLADLSPSMLATLGRYASAAAGISVTRAGATPPTRAELAAASSLYS